MLAWRYKLSWCVMPFITIFRRGASLAQCNNCNSSGYKKIDWIGLNYSISSLNLQWSNFIAITCNKPQSSTWMPNCSVLFGLLSRKNNFNFASVAKLTWCKFFTKLSCRPRKYCNMFSKRVYARVGWFIFWRVLFNLKWKIKGRFYFGSCLVLTY